MKNILEDIGVNEIVDWKMEIAKIIEDSPEEIEREMKNSSNNDWFACFNTRLQILSLTIDKYESEISEFDREKIKEKMKEIRSSVQSIEYIKNDFSPEETEEYKALLLKQLSEFMT